MSTRLFENLQSKLRFMFLTNLSVRCTVYGVFVYVLLKYDVPLRVIQ